MPTAVRDLPRRDRYVSDARRLWISLGVTMVVIIPGIVVYNVVVDLTRDDLLTYYIGTYMAFWVVMVVIYAAFTLWALRHRDRPSLERVIAATAPPKRSPVLNVLLTGGDAVAWTVQLALLSLAAIVLLFTNAQFRESLGLTLGGVAVVASCWVMMVLSFATTYAREDIRRSGLEFGGDQPPVFDDYLYQAITVSTSLAVSDVTATTTRMRRVVRAHALVAFVFNTVIVALLVSLLSGAVS